MVTLTDYSGSMKAQLLEVTYKYFHFFFKWIILDINNINLEDLLVLDVNSNVDEPKGKELKFDPKICSICNKKFDTVKKRNNHFASHDSVKGKVKTVNKAEKFRGSFFLCLL